MATDRTISAGLAHVRAELYWLAHRAEQAGEGFDAIQRGFEYADSQIREMELMAERVENGHDAMRSGGPLHTADRAAALRRNAAIAQEARIRVRAADVASC